MRFKPGELERAVRLLLSVVGQIQAKRGCRACTVGRDEAEGNQVRYAEEWETEASFHRHLHSEEFRRVLVAMEMSAEEPQVVVGNLAGHIGISQLQAIREHQNIGTQRDDEEEK